jgi:hypothetical protein
MVGGGRPEREGVLVSLYVADPELITEAETDEEAFENASDAAEALRDWRTDLC